MKACRVRFEVEELLRNKDKVVRAAKVRGVSNEGGKTTPLRGPIQHCFVHRDELLQILETVEKVKMKSMTLIYHINRCN